MLIPIVFTSNNRKQMWFSVDVQEVLERCTNHLKIHVPHLGLISATENTVEMMFVMGRGHITSARPVNTNNLEIARRCILPPLEGFLWE